MEGGTVTRAQADDTAPTVLELEDVGKTFGTYRALDGLSLRLRAGEVFALLGPNGAGKTTTLNLILGFLAPDSGRIVLDGIDVAAEPLRARQRSAYLPETVMLHPSLDAVENLRYFALLGGYRLDAAQAHALLDQAGLQRAAHTRRSNGYSKGMRQKVGLAIALAKQARVLLLDEPTSGLDASAALELSALVRTAAGRGMAVLMATHDLPRVCEVAHRIGILREGQLVLQRDATKVPAAQLETLYLDEVLA